MKRNIEKYVKDYLAHTFEDTMISYRRKKVLEFLSKYSPKNILEIGSGEQSLFEYYTQYDSFSVVEPSKFFVDELLKSSSYNSKIQIYNDCFENVFEQLKEKKFDFIVVSSLLHEISEPEKFLDMVKELCDKNTIVHINVPNANSFHLLWAYQAGLISKLYELTETAKLLQQNNTFDMKKLVNMCKNQGFSIIDKGSYFVKFFNHEKMAKLQELGLIDEKLLDGLYSLTEYFPENGAEIYVNCRVER